MKNLILYEREVEPPTASKTKQAFRGALVGAWMWLCTFGATLLSGGHDVLFPTMLVATWLGAQITWRRWLALRERTLWRRPRTWSEWRWGWFRIPVRPKDVIGTLGEHPWWIRR